MRYFPIEEYEARWDRVHAGLAARGYEAAVVWGRGGGTYDRSADTLYLANHYSSASGQELDSPLNNARASTSSPPTGSNAITIPLGASRAP